METSEREEIIEQAIQVVEAAGFRVTDPAHIAALSSIYDLFTKVINFDMVNEELRIQLEMVNELVSDPTHYRQ